MALTFDQLVNDVLQELYGSGLAQPRATFLTAGVDANDVTFPVTDASAFSQGVAEIGNELVFIETRDADAATLSISPDGRGYYGTTAAAHDSGTRIEFAPTWSRQKVASAINEAIINVYPTLFGVASTSFTYNPSINTYSVPAEAEQVLRVTFDTIGPSREQSRITRYSFNSVTPTGEFATGNAITLEEAGFPGRDVTVTYAKAPSEITFGDDFSDSGLRDSAKLAIKYAACASLTAYADAARIPVGTAQADEYDPSKSGLGQASRISAQLYQRYLIELENERKRLRATTPIPLNKRTR